MSRILKSSAQQIADFLRGEVLKGRWHGSLPGYRRLCDELCLPRRALLQAMRLLTESGFLSSNGARCAKAVSAGDPDPGRSGYRRICILSAKEKRELPATDIEVVTALERGLSASWTVEYIQSEVFRLMHPEHAMDKLVDSRPDSLWIIFGASIAMGRWGQAQGEGFLFLGGEVASFAVRNVSCSTIDISLQLLRALFQAGHRRVCVPWNPVAPTIRARLVSALGDCFREFDVPFSEAYNAPEVNAATRDEYLSVLDQIFRVTPPTGMVIHQVTWYLATLSFCARRGLAVPHDVSLATGDEAPILEWLDPVPLRVQRPVAQFVKVIQKWAAAPAEFAPGVHKIDTRIIPGSSIAPPPNSKPRSTCLNGKR